MPAKPRERNAPNVSATCLHTPDRKAIPICAHLTRRIVVARLCNVDSTKGHSHQSGADFFFGQVMVRSIDVYNI